MSKFIPTGINSSKISQAQGNIERQLTEDRTHLRNVKPLHGSIATSYPQCVNLHTRVAINSAILSFCINHIIAVRKQ